MTIQNATKRFESIINGKALKPVLDAIDALNVENAKFYVKDGAVCLQTSANHGNNSEVCNIAKSLMPWRKGPFLIDEIFIDAEWNSAIKFNLLEPYINAKDKVVGDIGCNNGYYLFRLLDRGAKELIGIDPGANFYLQFKFLDKFLNSGVKFYPYGVEHLYAFEKSFDLLFCLGVIYHRSDPVAMLKSLKSALAPNGEIILDSIILAGNNEVALCPKDSYAKMSNVYFIPTKKALENWFYKAGLEYEFLGELKTTTNEQRKTDWIQGQSLNDFLIDEHTTIEGYPAPIRAYYKCKAIKK